MATNRASGAKTSLTYTQEKEWGKVYSASTTVYGLNIRSTNLGGKKNLFQSETINQYRAVVGLGDGNMAVEGNIVTDLFPEGMEILLRHLLGKCDVVTTGSGPYKHVLKGVAETMQGISIQKAFTSVDKYFLYKGCRINSMAINIIQEGFHDVTWDIIGVKEEIEGANQLTGSGEVVYPTKSGFTGYQCKVYTDHAVPGNFVLLGNVISGNINITNNVETDGYVLGSEFRASAEHGTRECTGSWTMFFKDTTLYEMYKTGAECAVRFVFDNGTDTLTFEFPKVKIGGDSPAIESAGGVNLNMTFQARYDFVVEKTDVVVTIENTMASIEEEPS